MQKKIFMDMTCLIVDVNTQKPSEILNTQNILEDIKVNLKLKLATLWASFMFLYTYVDYFHLYMPGSIKDILAGKVFVFDISYIFLLIAMIFVAIPTLMIFFLLPCRLK